MVRHTGFEPATSWEGGAVRDLCDLLCKMFLGVSCLRGFLGAGPFASDIVERGRIFFTEDRKDH